MSENFAEVRKHFEIAFDLEGDARSQYMAQLERDHPEIANAVRSLIEADSQASSFLGGTAFDDINTQDWIGKKVASFTIVDVLAEGGMGIVFRASQENPKRSVALKLIRNELSSQQALRRFELEAEVLGCLDHPGIARIYEAGQTTKAAGQRPYLVMELIDGVPLDDYLNREQLSVEAKVTLLTQICAAVQHAHEHGIIHRDLKPSNILVTPQGQPKIVDFGVARVTDDDLRATMQTDMGQVIGTLPYMSPEQVHGRRDDLDTRSDVYALGVVAYEMITGSLPYDLRGRSLAEAARTIEEEEPTSLTSTTGRVPADIDTIVRKALSKERERRYASAGELGSDFTRFLQHEPISARSPSTVYQLKKFARRNRGLVAGLATTLGVLVLGLVVSVAGWSSASRERERAQIETSKATAMNDFFRDVLGAADPWQEGSAVKVIDILDQAAASIPESLGDKPVEVAAFAHGVLGTTYDGLAEYEKAGTHFWEAYHMTKGLEEENPEVRLQALRNLGQYLTLESNFAAADSIVQETLGLLDGLEGTPNEKADALHFMGLYNEQTGNLDLAESQYRQSLDISNQILGTDHEETHTTLAALGRVLMVQDKLDEAQSYLERASRMADEIFGPTHPSSLSVLNNLAFVYQKREIHDRALEMFSRSLRLRTEIHGAESPRLVVPHHNLALQCGLMEKFDDALTHHARAVELAETKLGKNHLNVHIARSAQGGTLHRMGRAEASIEPLVRGLSGLRSTLGDDHWRVKTTAKRLIAVYEELSRESEAAPLRPLVTETP